jgi:hypothetical protein
MDMMDLGVAGELLVIWFAVLTFCDLFTISNLAMDMEDLGVVLFPMQRFCDLLTRCHIYTGNA